MKDVIMAKFVVDLNVWIAQTNKTVDIHQSVDRVIDLIPVLTEYLGHLSDDETSFTLQVTHSPRSAPTSNQYASDQALIDKLKADYAQHEKNSKEAIPLVVGIPPTV